jgi:thiol-disulfide isomerase/thioredoxin
MLRQRVYQSSEVVAHPKAPELIGDPSDWLNTDGKALHLYGSGGLLSAGHCCMIDFWEYTCVNCIRTFPYIRAWDERYRNLGLTIIGIHTPEFAFARLKENVADAAKKYDLKYPILIDSKYANWEAFDNSYWPRHYLIDTDGEIVYDHAGEGGYDETESQIQRLLKKLHPDAKLPSIMKPVRGSDKPGAVCYPQTPEIYVGFSRGVPQFGSMGGFHRTVAYDYADSSSHENGRFYAKGMWKSQRESMLHARETKDAFEDYIALRYKALQANAVIRPENGKAFDLYLEQDGAPIPAADKGDDVKYAADGRSYVHVDAPRMYQLVSNRKWGEHELKMGSSSPDFALYSFTFSSCEVGGSS